MLAWRMTVLSSSDFRSSVKFSRPAAAKGCRPSFCRRTARERARHSDCLRFFALGTIFRASANKQEASISVGDHEASLSRSPSPLEASSSPSFRPKQADCFRQAIFHRRAPEDRSNLCARTLSSRASMRAQQTQTDAQTDGRTDRRTDGRTDGRTNSEGYANWCRPNYRTARGGRAIQFAPPVAAAECFAVCPSVGSLACSPVVWPACVCRAQTAATPSTNRPDLWPQVRSMRWPQADSSNWIASDCAASGELFFFVRAEKSVAS